MTRTLLLAILTAAVLVFSGTALAKGDNAAKLNAEKAAGKTIVYTCHGCHGVPGYENAYPNYRVPKIAGQNRQYIINALHDYKSGKRKHPTMDAQARGLTDQQIEDVATYLSSLRGKSH